MLRVSAQDYIWIGRVFEDLINGTPLRRGVDPETAIGKKAKMELMASLQELKKHASKIHAPTTVTLIGIAEQDFSAMPTWTMVSDRIMELERAFYTELATRMIMFFPPEKAKYFFDDNVQPQTLLFGELVATKFPSASYEIREAGACYATGRNTACVFHLMRVLEIGLTALGKVFGISLAHTNWAPAIEQIESKIRELHKDPAWKSLPDCKEQQEFYAQMASHFGVLKDAWRNYTAHARGKYDDSEAEGIFLNVRGFMQKLATKISE